MSVNGDGDRVERSTISGIPYEPVYTPKTTPIDYEADLGDPGSYPFTRGVHETMYRGKPWTMRMFAGFGTPEDTNRAVPTICSRTGRRACRPPSTCPR